MVKMSAVSGVARASTLDTPREEIRQLTVEAYSMGVVATDDTLGVDYLSCFELKFQIPQGGIAAFRAQEPRPYIRNDINCLRWSWYNYLITHDLINKKLAPWTIGEAFFQFAREGHVVSDEERENILPTLIFQELKSVDEVFCIAMGIYAYRDLRYRSSLTPHQLREIVLKTQDLHRQYISAYDITAHPHYFPEVFRAEGINTSMISRMKIDDAYIASLRRAIPSHLVQQFQGAVRAGGLWDQEIDMVSFGKLMAKFYSERRDLSDKKMVIAFLTSVVNVSFCGFAELLFTFYFEEKLRRSF